MTRRALATAALALVCGLLVACSTGGPGLQGPPVDTRRPERLVVLGGDAAFGANLVREVRLRASWPQLVLGALPPGSSMVDLASRGATTSDVVEQQLPLTARLQATIAIVSLEGSEPPAAASDVTRIVDALKADGIARVVVVTWSPTTTDEVGHSATVVDASTIPEPLDTDGHRRIADAITAALPT